VLSILVSGTHAIRAKTTRLADKSLGEPRISNYPTGHAWTREESGYGKKWKKEAAELAGI
jgi:hypothetical protein